MPDFLTSPFQDGPSVVPLHLFIRLVASVLLGAVVSWIYCQTRKGTQFTGSFPTTLILLSVLIAMVTQVIGDNVARAFSLVGALSIVRFRTVVRDTQDTAYVIFSVVVGMAVGAKNLWVAGMGTVIVAVAAFLLSANRRQGRINEIEYILNLRVAAGIDVEKLAGQILDGALLGRELVAISTARQGTALDVVYRMRLQERVSPHELVKDLSVLEGMQSVELQQRNVEKD